MQNVSEIIDTLEKQYLMLDYLAEAEDKSGLSEMLLQISRNIEQSINDLQGERKNIKDIELCASDVLRNLEEES